MYLYLTGSEGETARVLVGPALDGAEATGRVAEAAAGAAVVDDVAVGGRLATGGRDTTGFGGDDGPASDASAA